jgi:hypothetical protein
MNIIVGIAIGILIVFNWSSIKNYRADSNIYFQRFKDLKAQLIRHLIQSRDWPMLLTVLVEI